MPDAGQLLAAIRGLHPRGRRPQSRAGTLGTSHPQGGRQDRRPARTTPLKAPTEIELKDWIGRAKIVDDVPERTQTPGVATGLAVTGHGGDVLFIETTGFPTADGASPVSRSPVSSAT